MLATLPRIVKNTAASVILQNSSRILTLLFYFYLARVLGVQQFGIFTYALTVMTISGVLSGHSDSHVEGSRRSRCLFRDKCLWCSCFQLETEGVEAAYTTFREWGGMLYFTGRTLKSWEGSGRVE